jgi:hypothetical protein
LSTLNFFNSSITLNKNLSLISYYILNNYKNYFTSKSTASLQFLDNRFDLNLYNLKQESDTYSYLKKNKSGAFFLDDLNYQKFSNFLFNYEEL